ncbi:MAG TPA: VWA domain-containing protein [Polyangiaceae bacterium]|nr:VWA domain-containing protein [Polyangiaceae bacterium]
MSFVTALALGIALLVVAPLLAHRLRRLRADEKPFAAARLVPPAPPRARRRARLEDRALFGIRAAAIVALALLGASPLVRCSRLSLSRASGASMAVAIVVDDSMSMRATTARGRSRFARAKDAARELAIGARDGDAIAIVLAGKPPRVALAPTTELAAVSEVVGALSESDRGTDLDGALRIAETLLTPLPQIDKRIVLLSDLADGQSDQELGRTAQLPIWTPLAEIASDEKDCALLSADEVGGRVLARIACGPGATASGRNVEVRLGERVLASAPAGASNEVSVPLPKDAPEGEREARLTGSDAVAADDAAPVLVATTGALGVVAEASDESVATGGPPLVEQALAALRVDFAVRPIPAVPERAQDLSALVALVVDDPPGFTPEQRRALGTWLDGGGVMLLALGPRAAAAPLGATLAPALDHAPAFADAPVKGVAADAPTGLLGEATRSLEDLAARRRATIAPEDVTSLETLVAWSDGAPLVAKRTIGRGEVWIATLPFSLDASDWPVRPAFLSLLDSFVGTAHAHAAPRRTEVGSVWALDETARVVGPAGPVLGTREGGKLQLVPSRIGAYHVRASDREELRVASPVAKETDFRPRRVKAVADTARLGATEAQVDISSQIAVFLLALLFVELALRVRASVLAVK